MGNRLKEIMMYAPCTRVFRFKQILESHTGIYSFHHSEDSGRAEEEGARDDNEVCDPGQNTPIAIDHDDDDGNFVPSGSNSDRDKRTQCIPPPFQ